MKELIEKLNALVPKNSKINNHDRDQAVEYIWRLYKEDSERKTAIDYLMCFPKEVTLNFFKAKYAEIEEEELKDFFTIFVNNEKYKKNINDSSTIRAFCIISVYLENQRLYPVLLKFLNNILFILEKNGGYSKRCLEKFNEYIVKTTGTTFLNISMSELKETGKIRINNFVDVLCKEQIISYNDPKVMDWLNTRKMLLPTDKAGNAAGNRTNNKDILVPGAFKMQGETENITKNDEIKDIKITDNILEKSNKLLLDLEKASNLVLSMSSTLSENYGTYNNLKDIIHEKDVEIKKVNLQNKELTVKIEKLVSELADKNKIIEKNTLQISDLNERLELSLHATSINQNQELVSFKNELFESLELDYEDFKDSMTAEFNEDEFEARKAMLMRIFRSLKRLGIKFE